MIKTNRKIKNLQSIFKLYPEVKLVYLFGSQAQGRAAALSDYDFAVYLGEADFRKRFDLRLKLIDEVSRKLKTSKIDICILNDIQSPELKYNIVKKGRLVFEKEPFRILVEPRILNEYFDFNQLLIRYNLTKVK